MSSVAAAAPRIDIVQVRDEKASGSGGGTAATGAWTKHTINTESIDTGNKCAIASSVITLQPGTYEIAGWATFWAVANVRLRLQNTSDATTAALGGSAYFQAGGSASGIAPISGRFTITTAKNFEVQYYASGTTSTSDLGSGAGVGVVEVFADIYFRKVA